MKDRPNPTNITKTENGFTLIELLVSLLILAIGIIGVMAIFPQAYRGVSKAGRISTLNHLAYQKMDALKNLGAGNPALTGSASPGTVHSDTALTLIPPTTTDYYYPALDPGTSDPAGNEFADYSMKWTVIDNSPITGMKTVTIEVGYGIWYDSSTPPVLQSEQRQNAVIARYQFFIW